MPILPDMDYVRSIPDPAPNWRWCVRMPPLPARPAGSTAGDGGGNQLGMSVGQNIGNGPWGIPADALFSAPLLPFGIVEQIDFQTQTIDSDDRFQAASKVKYPRFLSQSSMAITFYEDVGYGTTQYLQYWRSLVVNDDHDYELPINYKRPIYLFAFNTVDNQNPTFVGFMRGCWPTGISGYAYSFEGSGKVTLSCEFAVDEAQPFAAGAGLMNTAPNLFNDFAARLRTRTE